MTEAEVVAGVARVFPITGPRFTIELLSAEVRDHAVRATMRMTLRANDGAIHDIREQEVYVLERKDFNERGIAFVEVIAAEIAKLPFDSIQNDMPHDLFSMELIDMAKHDDFAAAFARSRKRYPSR